MPRGTVIAVKPTKSLGETELMSASFKDPASANASSSTEEAAKNGNLVYIAADRGSVHTQEDLVFWYIDATQTLQDGDRVQFNINNSRMRSIKAAKDVKETKGKVIDLPKGKLLPQVALLASVLLLVAVSIDSKRK